MRKKIKIPGSAFLLFSRILGGLLVMAFLGSALLLLLGFLYFASDLPRPESILNRSNFQSTKVYDRTGQILLYELSANARRDYAKLSEVSPFFTEAILAAEDKNFYRHFGIDPGAIVRTLLASLKAGRIIGGASTITQQFVRNSLLGKERTITRKVKEVVLTLELEQRYPKDKILEFYINQISFGSNIYGIGAASSFYFGKEPSALSLGEAAFLAAIPKTPGAFSSSGAKREGVLRRKDYILERLRLLGEISEDQFLAAKTADLKFKKPAQMIRAPHFVMFVKDYIEKNYGTDFLLRGGLSVITTLDWNIQQEAEKIIEDGVKRNAGSNAFNAATVILNPENGEILAMVGSKDYFADPVPEGCVPGADCHFEGEVNVATRPRQPGSAFKPIAYALAFQKGIAPDTVVQDEETNFGIFNGQPYIPHNYDERFRGPVTLRQALAQSLNVPSIKVLLMAGIEDTINFAKDFGLTTLRDPSFYGPALMLGGAEVTLLELSSAYGVFATGGLRVPFLPVLKISGAGNDFFLAKQIIPQRILSPRVAEEVTSILSDNEARAPIFGRQSLLNVPGYTVAVKTGTTQDFRDAWTVGYTPSLVAGVWVGNNDNAPMAKKPGAMLAAPMWNSVMRKVLPLVSSASPL